MTTRTKHLLLILGLFILLSLVYGWIALSVYNPPSGVALYGYYGTIDVPRFADPWLARSEVILNGGLLYRDTFTATPPLTNYLFVLPSLLSRYFENKNPWATGSFMAFFTLFNLGAAYLLYFMQENAKRGLLIASVYLLNPLTFGNTLLRRQDESVIVFFIGLALLFMVKGKHGRGAASIGLALLVKLTAVLLLPIAVLHSKFNWRYFLYPPLLFLVAWLPFYFKVGKVAMFWSSEKEHNQHPFQFGGVSLGQLWNKYHVEINHFSIDVASVLFLGSLACVGLFILWKQVGILPDFALMMTVVLLFSPKTHTGYFSIIAFAMVSLLVRKRHIFLYLLFGLIAIYADWLKWPIEDFPQAFWLMVVTYILLAYVMVDTYRIAAQEKGLNDSSIKKT